MIMVRAPNLRDGSGAAADAPESSIPFGLIMFAGTIGFVSIVFAIIAYRFFASARNATAGQSGSGESSRGSLRIARVETCPRGRALASNASHGCRPPAYEHEEYEEEEDGWHHYNGDSDTSEEHVCDEQCQGPDEGVVGWGMETSNQDGSTTRVNITEETLARKTQLITCLNDDADLSGDEEENEIFL